MTETGARRVVLVGFMGAGKSTVGRVLADALGWSFVDADAEIVSHLGESIPDVFAKYGEAHFRAAERTVVGQLLGQDHVVIATGGGWAADPNWTASLPEGTAAVWLDVTPETAVRRVVDAPGSRPLLDATDPLERARELVKARTPSYSLATWKVDTERCSVEDVSARILEILGSNDSRMDAE